ncbi:MAG: cysteine desulfurase [Clostridium argentinense]|uniref:Cysteine desulfurase n=1 Tax=Clostridium faecium TaxID=2762223 RepID=A0ABR8YSX4_9CLOT|nr:MULTISPECIES: cysteine desulfurase family protein [Clostridium]MBD8047362.1 cysteine desulfurase [Clostridium faecium]MBS5823560.1 cysteine desulfurase [Clostridium argentinense]MDU1350258.1 cysteine desulfurase family protein [Clostridium argentinense]
MEVYFDNSATTKPYEEVIEEVSNTMREYFANPSSAHSLGFKAEQKLKECRESIAGTIKAQSDEIIFTSGGSESNNFLLRGFSKSGNHIITSTVEHPSVLNTFKALEKEGVKVSYISLKENGQIDIEELLNAITKDTVIVSIIHVNNEVGIIQDIEKIGNAIKEKSTRVKFHVDAVQSYGKISIDVQKCKVDLMSTSGHKLHGPRGVGFAYIRKGLVANPLIFGGGQERNFRSGTENLPAIAGFALASKIMHKNLQENYEKVLEIKRHFIERLKEIEEAKINSRIEENFLPHILSVSFPFIKGEVLLHALEEKNIYVSTGSACSSKSAKTSQVLNAFGLSLKEQQGTIRFSFCEYNTKDEVDYVIEALKSSLKVLRRMKR